MVRWLQRVTWPHGWGCLFRCPPWHAPDSPAYVTWEESRQPPPSHPVWGNPNLRDRK